MKTYTCWVVTVDGDPVWWTVRGLRFQTRNAYESQQGPINDHPLKDKIKLKRIRVNFEPS